MDGLLRIADGLYLVALPTACGQQRDPARQQIRAAARAALAGLLDVAASQITLHSTPGQPPHAAVDGRVIGISFSHEDGLSLAALHLHGPVGIDILRIRELPDWEALARDYLGPHCASALRAEAPEARPRALAQAWTAHEARLKCLGLQLTEWAHLPPAAHQPLASTTLALALALAPDLAATLLWGQR